MADGTMEEIAFAGRLAACAVGRNVRTHNYKAHGALVLDLKTGKKYSYFPTEDLVRRLVFHLTDSGWQVWRRRH